MIFSCSVVVWVTSERKTIRAPVFALQIEYVLWIVFFRLCCSCCCCCCRENGKGKIKRKISFDHFVFPTHYIYRMANGYAPCTSLSLHSTSIHLCSNVSAMSSHAIDSRRRRHNQRIHNDSHNNNNSVYTLIQYKTIGTRTRTHHQHHADGWLKRSVKWFSNAHTYTHNNTRRDLPRLT